MDNIIFVWIELYDAKLTGIYLGTSTFILRPVSPIPDYASLCNNFYQGKHLKPLGFINQRPRKTYAFCSRLLSSVIFKWLTRPLI